LPGGIAVDAGCRNFPGHKIKELIAALLRHGFQISMAPIMSSSSAILSVLIEAKELFSRHYILILFGVFIARLVYLRYLSPYRDIPGPFLATISPLWRLRAAMNGTINTDIIKGHKKYGKIFRISPDEVSISDPEAIRVIYAHGSGFTKVVPLNS
jgi:hypothetical protein